MSSGSEGKGVSSDNRHLKYMSWDSFGLVYRIIDSILLFAVISYQNCSLSYYLTLFNAHNNGWYFLFFVDFVLTFMFMSGALFASRYYQRLHVLKRRRKLRSSSEENKLDLSPNHDSEVPQIAKPRLPKQLGTLPLLWICWVLYAILLSTKIFVLHLQNIALQLYKSSEFTKTEERIDVEPHTVKLSLATMTVVFLLWIEIHRNHESNRSMECIKELTTTVVFEIFDSIDLLDLLLPETVNDIHFDSSHSDKYSIVILVLSTVNLLLPTIGLFRLSQNRLDSHKLGLRMNILHNFLRIVLVNIPYMLLRISFWLSIKREISIFLLKNALFIFVSIRHIVSEVNELRKLNKKPKDENELNKAIVSNESNRDREGNNTELSAIEEQCD